VLDAIGPVTSPPALGRLAPVEPRPVRPQGAQVPFSGELGTLISQVNQVQHEAADAIGRFATGGGENLHEVMLAVNKAELSFKFLMEARNKLVDAYHEVMRMQL
jgi:flagellar hook-basal body complex protein FliE